MTCPIGHTGPHVRPDGWDEPLLCGYCDKPLDEEWVVERWDEVDGRVWQKRIPWPDAEASPDAS